MLKQWVRFLMILANKLNYLYPLIIFMVFVIAIIITIHLAGKIEIDEKQELKIISPDKYIPLNGIKNEVTLPKHIHVTNYQHFNFENY